MLGISAKAGKVVCGTDATLEDIQRRKVCLVIVAEDASDKTKKNMEFICNKKNIENIKFGKIDDISRAIGKNNKAIIGIKSKSLAEQIVKLIKEDGGDLLNG